MSQAGFGFNGVTMLAKDMQQNQRSSGGTESREQRRSLTELRKSGSQTPNKRPSMWEQQQRPSFERKEQPTNERKERRSIEKRKRPTISPKSRLPFRSQRYSESILSRQRWSASPRSPGLSRNAYSCEFQTESSPSSRSNRSPSRRLKSPLRSPGMRRTLVRANGVIEASTRNFAKVTETTARRVGTAIQQSEEVYEKSAVCWLPRFLIEHFPRLVSSMFGVVVPLWFLILLSAGFGFLLVVHEAPREQQSNSAILESRARFNRTFGNSTELAQLPAVCYQQYLEQTDYTKFEERINEYILISSRDAANITNITNTSVINNLNYTIGDILDETKEELYLSMLKCQQEQHSETAAYMDVRQEDGPDAADSLRFNWNRCWSEGIRAKYGDRLAVYFPPNHLVEASHPAQQEAAVETEFIRILNEEESKCLELGGQEDECFEQALLEASEGAGNICNDNVEATSWFFFTIMTTVGYGNQTPVTEEGRTLVIIAGIACLILFAAVLGSSGYIITTIFDDFVSRLSFHRFVEHPLVGVLLWGGIWIGWAYAIAYGADAWWARRLPDYDVTVNDSLWFAFISTSTIGLGDYYLQPEVMFASDALAFSVTFLVGFVLLSTFLSKIGESLYLILPKRQNSLQTRLKNTNLIFWSHWPCNEACNDRIRSYVYKEKEMEGESSDDTEDGSSESPQLQMQQQEERVQLFKSQLPNNSLPPPINTMYADCDKDMEQLLDEEELILEALIESLIQRRAALNGADDDDWKSNPKLPKVKTIIPVMAGVGPPPLLEEEDDLVDSDSTHAREAGIVKKEHSSLVDSERSNKSSLIDSSERSYLYEESVIFEEEGEGDEEALESPWREEHEPKKREKEMAQSKKESEAAAPEINQQPQQPVEDTTGDKVSEEEGDHDQEGLKSAWKERQEPKKREKEMQRAKKVSEAAALESNQQPQQPVEDISDDKVVENNLFGSASTYAEESDVVEEEEGEHHVQPVDPLVVQPAGPQQDLPLFQHQEQQGDPHLYDSDRSHRHEETGFAGYSCALGYMFREDRNLTVDSSTHAHVQSGSSKSFRYLKR